ncbi:MAG: hypothetical protein WBG50_03190 [Desulfomonilaceae bacterium]
MAQEKYASVMHRLIGTTEDDDKCRSDSLFCCGGYKRFGDKLCEISAGLSPEELSTFFTPQKLFPLLKIQSDEKGVNINMAWRERLRAQVPELPKNLPPLSQCIYGINEQPNQEFQARFIKNMKRAYEKDVAMKTNGHDDPKASANPSIPN